MTLNQITALIATGLDKELDIPFRLQLGERVKAWRARLMVNHLQKNPNQRRNFIQTIYLEMVRGTAASTVFLDDTKSESRLQVPQVIKLGNSKYDYLGGVDGNSPFKDYITGTASYMEAGKFHSRFTHFAEINRYIIVDKKQIEKIRIDALYSDPLEAASACCNTCPDGGCDVWNMEFPMSGDFTQLVIQSILQIDYNRKDTQNTPEVELNPKP
jgi:hypothetical protein